MLTRARIAGRCLALLVGPALLVAIGCSDSGIGKLYGVSGTVKYKGEPVAKARINFVPKDGGKSTHGASGDVVDGKFSSLTSMTDGDGAMAGEYFVTIIAKDVDQGKVAAESDELFKKHGMGKTAMMPPELLAKATKAAKSSIPTKYEDPGQSGLKATVTEGGSNKFEFELKD
jgi:hypothetical protein